MAEAWHHTCVPRVSALMCLHFTNAASVYGSNTDYLSNWFVNYVLATTNELLFARKFELQFASHAPPPNPPKQLPIISKLPPKRGPPSIKFSPDPQLFLRPFPTVLFPSHFIYFPTVCLYLASTHLYRQGKAQPGNFWSNTFSVPPTTTQCEPR